jgi:ABC-2 type transport system ATP-binding protein
MTSAVAVEGLIKKFGPVVALDGLDLDVAAGEAIRGATPSSSTGGSRTSPATCRSGPN